MRRQDRKCRDSANDTDVQRMKEYAGFIKQISLEKEFCIGRRVGPEISNVRFFWNEKSDFEDIINSNNNVI